MKKYVAGFMEKLKLRVCVVPALEAYKAEIQVLANRSMVATLMTVSHAFMLSLTLVRALATLKQPSLLVTVSQSCWY